MIICNIPIKASQTFRICFDWLKRLTATPSRLNKQAKVALVYFSYEPDFEFLLLSLKSATAYLNQDRVKSIHIFIDQKKPFTQEQEQTLQQHGKNVIFKPIYNFSWASTDTTEAELKAFLTVASTLDEQDMLAKVDSDILFMQSNRLDEILSSDVEAVGDGHHVNYQYAQGGLYFIRNCLFKKVFPEISRTKIIEAEGQVNNKGEDIVISQLLKNAQRPFYLTRFMLFPDEYRMLNSFTSLLRKEFFALHFVKDKQRMPDYIARMKASD